MNGNSGKAVKLYENLVEQQPENAAFRGHLANAYLHRQFNRKAISAFEKAIEIDEDNISNWLGLAETYLLVMETYKADEIYKKALEKGKEKGWDLSIIYFKLIMKEILANNYYMVREYLDKLVELINDNDETDDNIPWKLAELGEDYRIPEEVEAIVTIKVLPKEVTDFMEDKEAIEISNKMEICMNIDEMKTGIRILKKEYPELYKLEKKFFQRVTNKNKIKKLTEEINERAMKNPTLVKMIEEAMRFQGIKNFVDEEDDDFEFDDPFGFEDRDIPDWVEPQEPFIREEKKVGRNEPCPCGSGKKYKKCCGK